MLFVPSIVAIWNSLPYFIVNVDSINNLDTFWSNQDIMFDYIAELAEIGDRSEFIM